MNLLKEISSNGKTIIMATHDYNTIEKFKGRIIKFENHFYLNTGDWIESCSAIVELMDGTIQLIKIDDNNIVKVAEL